MSTTDLLIKQLEVISHVTPSQSLLIPENSTQASQELRYPQLTHVKLRQQIQTLEAQLEAAVTHNQSLKVSLTS